MDGQRQVFTACLVLFTLNTGLTKLLADMLFTSAVVYPDDVLVSSKDFDQNMNDVRKLQESQIAHEWEEMQIRGSAGEICGPCVVETRNFSLPGKDRDN